MSMERDPSGGREHTDLYPDIRFLPDYEGVQELTYGDQDYQYVLFRDDLPAPVRVMSIQVDGSSVDDGYYGFRGDINLLPTDDNDTYSENAFHRFAEIYEARQLPNDELLTYIFESAAGYVYVTYLEPDGSSIGIITCGHIDKRKGLIEHANDRLNHEEDEETDALLDFLLQQKRLLSETYRAYGLPISPLRLTVAPYEGTEKKPSSDEKKIMLRDLGGMHAEKAQLEELILGLQHPEVMAAWGVDRPSGLLLYGPPGTGKTTLVEAVANELGADLLTVRSDQIYGKWMGESERNFQAIINRALSAKRPTVLLFDEIDTIIRPNAGSAYATVAGLFKQSMSNITSRNPNLMVIATTNEPDNMDPALIRAGRFDLKLYIPTPDEEGRADIFLTIISSYSDTPKRTVFDIMDIDTGAMVKASDGLTGADISAVLKKLVAARAITEIRSRQTPPPITTSEIVSMLHRHRQQQT